MSTLQIQTLHPDYRECILDIDIYGRIVSTPQQSLEELTQALFEEFKRRKPMPTLESRRYELSRPVSSNFQVTYDEELELQDGESLVDISGGVSSLPKIDFPDLSILADVQESFTYEQRTTVDIRQSLIEKFDLATGEEFKPGIRQTELVYGSTEEDKSLYMSDEQIDALGSDEDEDELAESIDETVVEVPEEGGVVTAVEEYDVEQESGGWGYGSDDEEVPEEDGYADFGMESDGQPSEDDGYADFGMEDGESAEEQPVDLGELAEETDDFADFGFGDEPVEEQPTDLGNPAEESVEEHDDFADFGFDTGDSEQDESAEEEISDDSAEADYSGAEDGAEADFYGAEESAPAEESSEDGDEADYFGYGDDSEVEEGGSSEEESSEDSDEADYFGYEDDSGVAEESPEVDDADFGFEQPAVVEGADDELDLGFEEPEFIPAPPPVVQRQPPRPAPQPVVSVPPVQAATAVVDRSSEPTDIRAFVRKYPRCEVSFALKYFTKKQIDDAVRLGRIIKKGNILR